MEPHVVGFRIEGGRFDEVRRCVRAVRSISTAMIVLGGPTATSHPREVLDGCDADYVFAGEAEEPFNQFLRLAHEPDSIDRAPEIPGLAYRYGGCTFLNTLPCDGYDWKSILRHLSPACRVSRRLPPLCPWRVYHLPLLYTGIC